MNARHIGKAVALAGLVLFTGGFDSCTRSVPLANGNDGSVTNDSRCPPPGQPLYSDDPCSPEGLICSGRTASCGPTLTCSGGYWQPCGGKDAAATSGDAQVLPGDDGGTTVACSLGLDPYPCTKDSQCSAMGARCDLTHQYCVCITQDCTPGQDSTCNADPTLSVLEGYCGAFGSCRCNSGFVRDAQSGKCRARRCPCIDGNDCDPSSMCVSGVCVATTTPACGGTGGACCGGSCGTCVSGACANGVCQ